MDVLVAVVADDAQVEDGGCAAHNVEGDPDVAELLAEHPLLLDLVNHAEGHDDGRH